MISKSVSKHKNEKKIDTKKRREREKQKTEEKTRLIVQSRRRCRRDRFCFVLILMRTRLCVLDVNVCAQGIDERTNERTNKRTNRRRRERKGRYDINIKANDEECIKKHLFAMHNEKRWRVCFI